MNEGKLPIGSRVHVSDRLDIATVARHGRDANGIYTEVMFDDGARDRYHRSQLRSAPTRPTKE